MLLAYLTNLRASPSPDFQAISGFYSQLAGILAGFAFAGLVALIGAQLTSGTIATAALQGFIPLISAFVGLVGASLNYAIISGEAPSTKRVTVFETIGGLGFAVAGLMLFYSVLVLLHGVQVDYAARSGGTTPIAKQSVTFVRWLIVFALAPALILLVEGGVRDQELSRYGVRTGWHWPDLSAGAFALLVIAYGSLQTYRTRRLPTLSTLRSSMRISAAAAIIAILCIAGTTLVIFFASTESAGSDWLRFAELLIMTCFDAAVIFSASKYR